MENPIYDKTEKGRREIASRQHRLPARLRTLLLLVDGRRPGTQLLEQVAGIGLGHMHLQQLQDEGFISVLGIDDAEDAPRFRALYDFYTSTIKSNIGLRGYALQLQVEKATTSAALAALREPYLEALLQARGNDVARSLGCQLDALIHR